MPFNFIVFLIFCPMVEALVRGVNWCSFGCLYFVFVLIDGYLFTACRHFGAFVELECYVVAFGVFGCFFRRVGG